MPSGRDFTRKPAVVLICSLVYLLNPIGNVIYQWRESGQGFADFARNLFSLVIEARNPYAIVNAALWVIAPIVALGIFRVRLWGWFAFLIHSVAVASLSLFDRDLAFKGLSTAAFINFPFFAVAGFYLLSEIRAPYFNPRLRWWERRPRYRDAIRVGLEGGRYVMYDISEKGIFIADARAEARSVGSRLMARIDLGLETITVKMEVVRVHLGGGEYPAGFGARFTGMDAFSRQHLKAYMREMRRVPAERGTGAKASPGAHGRA
jgi:hypothetical protein